MNYNEKDSGIVLTDIDSFNISEILECGQCFRFYRLAENHYRIIAYGKVLYIKQDTEKISFYPCTKEEFENIWIEYFDLNRDYLGLKKLLSKDAIMSKAIKYASGIRILKQETFECLISFIISQNNRIPMIKQVVENISKRYGEKLTGDFYAFPSIEMLSKATVEELMLCKTGFRAKYIVDACNMINSGEVRINEFMDMNTSELRQELIKIKGVGPKIADCVLLFSQGRSEVFPTDVWIKRVMSNLYFGKDTEIDEIHRYAYDNFGEYAGIAQQYLFNYARLNGIK